MSTIKTGIIGGTGIYRLPGVTNTEKITVTTDYGNVVVTTGVLAGKKIAFLTRHGEGHSISPGQINYQANIQAMAKLGVKQIFATACSGSLNPEYVPGTFAVVRQFLEFTKNRPASFYYNDGSTDMKIAHVDLTEPYCDRLSQLLLDAGKQLNLTIFDHATYVCVEGPRFETKAEVQYFQSIGADLVAQTQYPEVALAREAEICYAVLGIPANMAAGISDEHVVTSEVQDNMNLVFGDVQKILIKAIELVSQEEDCWCQHALEGSFA